ncbi:MAG: hypothetical protein HOW73_41990 [Polyangiaceae bacterium]|nr:hypothetical protein [Polyangiaceae bacterium]
MAVRAFARLLAVLLTALIIAGPNLAALVTDAFCTTAAMSDRTADSVELETEAAPDGSEEAPADEAEDSSDNLEPDDPLDDDICHLPTVLSAPPMTSLGSILHEEAAVPDRALPPADKVA